MKINNKDVFYIRSKKKKCCLCLGSVLTNDSSCQLILNGKKYKHYTELGKMLISILKLSNNTLTKYCCQVCVDTVVKCFDALLEINVAASLACQELSVKDGGLFECAKCNEVLTSIDKFTLHFKSHLLDFGDYNLKEECLVKEPNKDSENANPQDGNPLFEEVVQNEDSLDENDCSWLKDNEKTEEDKNNSESEGISNLCHECGKSYVSKHSLKLHLRRHDPEFKSCKRKSRIKGCHLCDKCGKSFTTIETLRVHREKHDTTCNICGKSMYKKYIKRHLLLHSSQLPRLQIERNYPKRIATIPALECTPLQCNHCDKFYIDRFMLVNHIAMMHGGSFEKGQKRGKRRGIECSLCGLVLLSQPKLRQHKKEEHGVTCEERMQCELCKRWYSGKMCLRTHIKYEHMHIKPFNCKLCPKVFKRHQGLWAHMRAHQDVRPYECGVCQVRYRQRYEVVNHLGKHVRAGDIKLEQAYAKKMFHGKLEPGMIYLKDQKLKQVCELASIVQLPG